MTPRWHTISIVLPLGFLALCGCSRGPSDGGPPAQVPPAPAPTSHEISGWRITVADPDGRWTFGATAEHARAADVEGPYELAQADCRYQQAGRAPVIMRAARAHLDKQAGKLVLEGAVRITSGAWQLEEADRVEYDLNAGEVVAPGRTKWTFDANHIPGAESRPAEEEGNP